MKERDLLKRNTIKSYIKDILKMRVSKTAANELRIRVNALVKTALRDAQKSARSEDRSTIMPRDLTPALDSALGKKRLSTKDIFKGIKSLSAIELGDLSKKITQFIKESKNK